MSQPKMKTEFAIEANGLIKRYDDDVLAVDGVNLNIRANSTYALLGPNGAGKTTTMSILTTLIEPTAGSAKIFGLDVVRQANDVRNRIGVTFQETVLDDELTGRQVLDFHGRLYSQNRKQRQLKITDLLTTVELEDAADRRVKTYSGGMKRRLELARGLMTEPDLLFLDEPTLGLDPQNRANIWAYIRDLKARKGITIMMTTHYMEEAEQLADCVGIIDQGQIVTEGTPGDLIDQMGADAIRMTGQGNSTGFVEKIRTLPYVQALNISNGWIQIGVDIASRRLAEIVSLASSNDFLIEDLAVAKPSLGDVYLKFTGHQLRDR